MGGSSIILVPFFQKLYHQMSWISHVFQREDFWLWTKIATRLILLNKFTEISRGISMKAFKNNSKDFKLNTSPYRQPVETTEDRSYVFKFPLPSKAPMVLWKFQRSANPLLTDFHSAGVDGRRHTSGASSAMMASHVSGRITGDSEVVLQAFVRVTSR